MNPDKGLGLGKPVPEVTADTPESARERGRERRKSPTLTFKVAGEFSSGISICCLHGKFIAGDVGFQLTAIDFGR